MSINENDAPAGYKAESGTSCLNCDLFGKMDCMYVRCAADERDDGRNVIFVARTGAATAAFPYGSCGEYVDA